MEPDFVTRSVKENKSKSYFFNRELSLLEFNSRVLEEARNDQHPLLERLKFIAILSSNLDEFFMIRVAGLIGQKEADIPTLSFDGLTPQEQLFEIRKRLEVLYENQEKILNDEILPALEKEGVVFHSIDNLSKSDKEFLKNYFCNLVLPVLTPLSLDQAHPFPRIINRSLNIAFVLEDKSSSFGERRISILQLPSILPRFVNLKRSKGYHFVMLEDVIIENSEILFPGYEIITANTFRVTRDADIEIADDEAEDLLKEVAEQIKLRSWGTAAVRLEINANMPDYLVGILKKAIEIDDDYVYTLNRPLKLPDFMELSKIDIHHLKDVPFQANIVSDLASEDSNIFDTISKKDILVHRPFDSFTQSVLKFLNTAASDSKVVAIKITLYRVGMNSPVVDALKRAAENGKDVTVFVELKARFDEENNIIWAKELEQLGVHVIYGVLGLKTHCKIALVVRKEADKFIKYLHLSTGNYNLVTSRLYTDVCFFTVRPEFTTDAIFLFNYLTSYSYQKEWNAFLVAPINLRQQIISLIDREIDLHTPDNPSEIFIKMNSIAHEEVIQRLYKASQKGVKIKLLIRGVCCLRPGVEGLSENIEVRSIIGRFLEHSRIFYFKNGGKEEIYLGSADWMSRNLHKRVELMFPIYDKTLQKKLINILNIYWQDNSKSWRLLPNGKYEKISHKEKEKRFAAQEYFLQEIKKSKKKNGHSFIPYIQNRI
ncbi:MAG TPA: polyphosphate kinase 1 [Candidatus Kapabacteria bacterium]|nr:polyphosphate kinase 1 [Candidatus Kapabacteria bacterium]HPO63168.1 polyphosphate kinase 1 [Candidatus Kapabacteria bacterium]